jgi:tRNA 2-thiouridine synthesizing protein A
MASKKLDVRGAKCPIPIVRARQAVDALAPGDELEVLATDPGSVRDFQGWATMMKSAVLKAQRTERDDGGREIYVHVIERT